MVSNVLIDFMHHLSWKTVHIHTYEKEKGNITAGATCLLIYPSNP